MPKRTLVLGVVLLGLCLGLSASAQSQSNEAVEFVKLLNEAENSFLTEDYAQAKTALEKSAVRVCSLEWLEKMAIGRYWDSRFGKKKTGLRLSLRRNKS